MKEKQISFSKSQLVLGGLLIVAAFFIGTLYTKVQYLEKNIAANQANTAAAAQQAQQAQPGKPNVSLDTIKGLFGKDLIKFGDANKKVLLVEIADPSCPFCHIAAGRNSALNNQTPQFKMVADGGAYVAPIPEFKKLVDSGKASFVYIYSPGHGSGEMAVRALYCAFEKGKFWQVHDLIMSEKGYEIQNGTDPAGAASTGPIVKNDKTKSQDLANFLAPAMNPADMKACLDSGKYDARLGTDTQLASSLGIQGTPGFFVNATNFAGAYPFGDMKSVIDAALK